MDYYLELLKADKVNFLVKKEKTKKEISQLIRKLKKSKKIHDKIEIAKDLWKILFKSAMSFIDPNRKGYDKLFRYFDTFVSFEELIFASDSFYRDHTLHCLWVYFLGEYLYKNPEYKPFFRNFNERLHSLNSLMHFYQKLDDKEIFQQIYSLLGSFNLLEKHEDPIRCVIALTHDLGYPLKKITKINKSIRNILPFFSIKNYKEFNFEYESTQQFFIESFLEILSSHFSFLSESVDLSFEERTKLEEYFSNLEKLLPEVYAYNYDTTSEDFIKTKEVLSNMSDEQKYLMQKIHGVRCFYSKEIGRMMRYSNDFEEYQHGIMSAFLLSKMLNAFSNITIEYSNPDNIPISNVPEIVLLDSKVNILQAIADHTSQGYQIRDFTDYSAYLLFIDEIEEFSRLSRANQLRQFVNEFCKTDIRFIENTFEIDFIFDNKELPELDPEYAFKGKTRKLLTIFDIPNLAEHLRIKFRCIGKIPTNSSTYELLIGKNKAEITIDGKQVDIAKYLGSEEMG